MAANTHLIGKQVLALEINAANDAYAIQQKMSELVHKKLIPALSDLFDTLISDTQVVLLDSVTIDIGSIQLDGDYEDKIIHKIMELLEKTIKDKLDNTTYEEDVSRFKHIDKPQKPQRLHSDFSSQEKELDSDNDYGKHSHISKKEKQIDRDDVVTQNKNQSLRRHYFDLWLYWLEKGRLPSYTIQPEEDWMPLILETLGLDIDAITILKHTLRNHPIAKKRLILQHTAKDLKSIVELYTGFSQTWLLDLCKEIKYVLEVVSLKSTSTDYRVLEIDIWQHIFKTVILDRKKLDSFSLGVQVIKLPSIALLIDQVNVEEIINNKAENSLSMLQEILQKEQKGSQITPEEKEISLLKDEDDIDNFRDEDLENEELFTNEEHLESPQFFNNAGVVVLHPFLSSFFEKLGLLEEKDFIDFNARSKAVMLLHYLATAEEAPKEYEMVLPKFLCEMPVNIPLDHTIVLTKEEKEEANTMLQAAINHWGALGGSSPDGLREGFLKRQGKLEQDASGWKLYIEQKTMDILLDRLPWNLSLIKLPWMTDILKVEWR